MKDVEMGRVLDVVQMPSRRPEPRALAVASGGDDPTLGDLARCVVGARWLVLGCVALAVALGLAYVAAVQPAYRASALVQAEERPRAIIGADDRPTPLPDQDPSNLSRELLRSRALIAGVVEKLGLDVEVRPRMLPLLGPAVARAHRGHQLAAPFLGLRGHAWGGERLRVEQLEVSPDLVDQPLSVTATPGGYLVEAAGGLRAAGAVGTRTVATAGGSRVEVLVSELVARPGTGFTLLKRNAQEVIDRLDADLRVTERGNRTGLFALELEGADPARAAATLDALADALVRQDVERRSAEASRSLTFVESLLPGLRRQSEEGERALTSYRLARRTVDLPLETQSLVQRSADLDKALLELEQQRSELTHRYTDRHPAVVELDRKTERLQAERAALGARAQTVPETEQGSARLLRDAKASTELYALMLNKAQELRMARSSAAGGLRIVDRATASLRPVRPRPLPVLALSLALGLGVGVAAAFARRSLAEGVDDAEELERGTGVPVFATVPHSRRQERIRMRRRLSPKKPAPILTAVDPSDAAVESLRCLRTGLQPALADAANNVIAIAGPAPGAGKSFVTLNLACVLAAAERRVIVVDADLRRGRLHRHFGLERGPGLSDALSGSQPLAACIRSTRVQGLDLLPTGAIPKNPAELLAGRRLEQVIDELSRRYDLVVLDTPPILAVTDAAVVARRAGVNVLVVRSGEEPIREIALAVERLRQGGIQLQCAVLNDVGGAGDRYGRYGRYLRYEHRSLRAE